MAWELHSVTNIGSDLQLVDKGAAKQQYSHALCTNVWVYVIIDINAFKVNRVTQQVTEVIQFDSAVDAVGISSEEAWVVIGTRNGVLHFLSVELDRVMFSQAVVLPASEDVPLLQVKCSVQNEEGKCNLLILTSSNQVIIFPGINLASLDTSMQEEDIAQMLKPIMTVRLDLRSCHGSGIPCSVSFQDDNIISTGKMCGIQLWEKDNDDYVISDVPLWILSDTGVRKCEISPDNKLFLVITECHRLVVLQLLAGLAVLTNVWKEMPVQDFAFCHSSFSQTDQKACILTASLDRKPAMLSVVTLPGLMVVHSINVSSSAALCSGVMSEDCILFTDLNINNGQASIRLNQLMLSEGEDKLRRLIQQKKFTEAESYALNNDLNAEMVYKAQAEFLMDAVCNDASREANELLECLKKIKDVEFVCELCTLSPMLSYNATCAVVEHCYQVSCSHTSSGDLHKKITIMLHKLTMFRLVYGSLAFSVESWQSFLTTTVVDKLKLLVQQGDFSKAAYIWTASLGELIECVDTEVMVDILKAIPEASSSNQLTSWIRDIILPFILEHLPLMLKDFLSWAENIVYRLEEHEKEKWPDNSFNLVTAIQKLLLNRRADVLIGGDALYKLWDDLVRQLEDLCYLQKELQFSISLAQHSKVTSEKIVYQLLDRVAVPELVPSVIKSQIRPYCARHKLNVDTTLFNYIKRPGNQVKSPSEFALERKIVMMVNAISSEQYQVDVCTELVTQYSSSRWSNEMEQLVKKCLTFSCTGVEELSSRYKWMCLKRILLEYGVTDFSLYPSVKLIRYILKQRCFLQDALQVADYYQLPQTDVYFYHIQNLFLAGEFSSGWELLHSLDAEIGCTVATDVFTNSLEHSTLFTGILAKDEHIRIITTCVLCLKYLKEKASTEQLDTLLVHSDQWDCDVDSLLHRLHCLHILVEKYSVHLSLRQLSDKRYCAELLGNLTDQYLISALSQNNEGADSLSVSNLVSIAVLLGFCKAEVYRRLLRNICKEVVSVDQQKLTSILSALDDTPNKETATVLQQCMMQVWRVASDVAKINLDQQQKLLEILDNLATKAVTVSPAGLLMECVEMWRALRLCIITGRQCKDDVSFSTIQFQPQEEHTCYDLWCWPRRYLETGMILDYGLIMPLVMTSASLLINTHPGNPSSMLSLCKSLANNGFHQMALQWALIAYHHSLKQEVTVTPGGPPKKPEPPQGLKEYGHAIKGLLKEILSKVLSAKRLEHFYGLSLLLSNYPQISRKQLSLEGMHHRMNSGHFTTIQGVCQLSVYYGCITGDREVTKMARDYYQHASWGRKLEQYKVPITAGDKSAVVKVLGAMMKEPDISVAMIIQYSKDYHLKCEEVLARYLTTVLEKWPRGYQSVVTKVIGLLKTTEWIEKFFCDTLDKVNPYDYERIGFLLEQLKLLGSKEWTPMENLVLLDQLKEYSRVSAPSQCELQFYQHHIACFTDMSNSLIVNDQQLPAESKRRLPFHALLEETTAESIITAELYRDTISIMLPIASELKISAETCYSLAIKNELAVRPEDVSVDNIIDLISRIDDFSVAISAAKWTSKQLKLPQDADKRAKILEKAKELAKHWESSLSSSKEKEKITLMLQQLTVAHQSTMVEQLLVEYDIASPRYMKQVEYIGLLITDLYTDVPELGDTPVHEIVGRLLLLKPQLKFQKICHKLLDKWLHSGGVSPDATVDQDITQHNISVTCVDDDESSEEAEINFKRLCYLLGNQNHLEQNIKHLLSILKADSSVISTRTKLTIYKILFAIAPVKLLEKMNNTSINVLNSQYQLLRFLCDMDCLHIPLTPEEFQTINKIGVIHQLLKNHSHEPKAMWLVAQLCQQYEITEAQPWAALLKQMHALGMIVHIRKLLLGLPSKLNLSLVPVLTSLWEPIIMYPFKQGVSLDDQPMECETSIKLLHKIGIPSAEITEHFVTSLWAVGLRTEALFCCNMINTQKQAAVHDLLGNLSPTDYMTLLNNAESSCLLYSKPVTEILYNYIDSEFKYELVYGTAHFQRLVMYLLENDQLEHLVVTSLRAKRLPEAIQLVEMYYQDKDKLAGTEALKEYISSHDLEMAISEL